MAETKRQKQVAAVIEKEMNDIFQRMGLATLHGGLVSISGVNLTPDLYEARIHLSFFQVQDAAKALAYIQDHAKEIKKELTARVRHQLRIMPVLQFFGDETLAYVDHIEKLLRDIQKNDGTNPAES
ncbi:MAG: ribosome-binding factor A [Ferruginibacter sp.]